MDAIRYAVSCVRRVIPPQVLDKTFLNRQTSIWGMQGLNVDHQIEMLVIRPRVLQDCNLVGGTSDFVEIGDLPYDKPDAISTIIRIPKSRTQGRSIVSALNVSFLNYAQAGTWFGGGSYYNVGVEANDTGVLAQLESSIMRANDKIPVVSTSEVTLIADNVIMIRDLLTSPGNMFLRCIIENDSNLNNISPRSYPAFAQLVEYAVKSYVYNTMIVTMDQNALQGGFELGVIKSVIEGYSDSEQNYKDYLNQKWRAIAMMNDTIQYGRYLKLAIGSSR